MHPILATILHHKNKNVGGYFGHLIDSLIQSLRKKMRVIANIHFVVNEGWKESNQALFQQEWLEHLAHSASIQESTENFNKYTTNPLIITWTILLLFYKINFMNTHNLVNKYFE